MHVLTKELLNYMEESTKFGFTTNEVLFPFDCKYSCYHGSEPRSFRMAKGQGEGCDFWGLPSHHGEHQGRYPAREVHHSVIPYGPKAGKIQSALVDKGNMVWHFNLLHV